MHLRLTEAVTLWGTQDLAPQVGFSIANLKHLLPSTPLLEWLLWLLLGSQSFPNQCQFGSIRPCIHLRPTHSSHFPR